MDIKEFPSEDPHTKAWITSSGTKIACRQIPHEREENNFHIEAKFETGTSDELPIRFGGKDREGIAHTGEHTPYLGTESYPGSWVIPVLVESLNGNWGASTKRDTTEYWLHVPKEHAQLASEIAGELIRHPCPDPEVLSRELVVIDTERATADLVKQDIVELNQLARGDNPDGYPIIGTQESILSTTYEDIIKFRDRTYRSGRLAVAAEGDLPHEHMLGIVLKGLEIARKGGQLAEGVRERKLLPKPSGGILFDDREKTETTTQTYYYAIPESCADKFTSLVYEAGWGLFHYGSDAFSLNELRVKRGMIYSFTGGGWLERDGGCCFASYETFPRFVADVRRLFAKELKGLHDKPDFYRARLALLNSQTVYHIKDRQQKSPFYGTGSLTDNLLFNTVIPRREYVLDHIQNVKYNHVVEAIDKLRANPPSLKLRGIVNDRPSYDQICEMFQPTSPRRRRAATARPQPKGAQQQLG